ncbi:hypothetical protein [Azohydromonas aeria]|uniref:hypothetical protein n=1 Tax=Azohydromonas aeria TaxID=2590212 RepID=UPI0012F7DCC4|nr:hypothetical protein [Azohydromonas aeria]
MSDPHDLPFIYLLGSGAIAFVLLLGYGTYQHFRDKKRRQERREQRRADRRKSKRRM